MQYAISTPRGIGTPIPVESTFPVRLLMWSDFPEYEVGHDDRISFKPDFDEMVPISELNAKIEELVENRFNKGYQYFTIPLAIVED